MTTTSESTRKGARLTTPALLLTLLAFAQLIIALDYNIVFVALPAIGEGLGFTDSTLQWVVSAYAVAFGGFLLLGGRLTDLIGKRRAFIVGLLLYAVSSLTGALATDPIVLVVARAAQGLGGAFLSPATLSLVSTSFPEGRSRTTALSVWAAAGSTGMVLGSLLGGILTGSLGWESVFTVNVVLAAIAMTGAFLLIPRDQPFVGSDRPRLDIPGALTGTIGVLAMVFALVQAPESGWLSPLTLVPTAVGVAFLVAFFLVQRVAQDPLIPAGLFRASNLGVGTGITFLFMATFGALPFFLTRYLQQELGFSPLLTGLAFIIPSVSVLVGATWAGHLGGSHSPRAILATAFSVGALGTAVLATGFAVSLPTIALVVPLVVLSVAQGVVFTTMYAVATSRIAAEQQGTASGIATAGQQIGGAMGLAALVLSASAVGGSGIMGEITAATFLIAVGLVAGVAVSLLSGRGRADRSETVADTADAAR
ncbi:EmrB/QacA subfamily drug resistance transporter [Rathayibacter agropyri]